MLQHEERFDYRLEALWTLRDALEYPVLDSSSQQQFARLYRAVPAATKLVETIGQKICQWCHDLQGRLQEDSGPGDPLWTGQRGFCVGRWIFVAEERLLELSDESSLGEETRESAKKAAQTMSKLSQRCT
jgi:hypothetical protein